ncbi:Crp/Fnr family transcriptional regulator [Labrenzia sp. PHM005]|uniref:Crp/Fnr family transcriptional regulator n=1 Tax=Labrenzia sp. PHM005 TaxID=2590016 RepID=UPI00114041B1|nr:Crp/Fnr family transcriptional regulator [Labrenzia sp. PHM005]QDG75988.1 Crp/Fnr family transcriptional regulator [Labrenzia sp. PHM005]
MSSYNVSINGNLECGESMCAHRLCRSAQSTHSSRRHKMLRRGDRLDISEGFCRKIWVILSGMTAICIGLADGRRQILGIETAGNVICGVGTSAGPRTGEWIEALCDTMLCELDLQTMVQMSDGSRQGCPEALVSELFNVMHQRLEECSAHLVTLGRLDSTERVTLFLLDMANRIGRPVNQGIYVELPMTREDIADYLGLNTETISRIFTRLKKSKLVQFPARNAYSLIDPAALQRRLPLPVPETSTNSVVREFLTGSTSPQSFRDGACS